MIKNQRQLIYTTVDFFKCTTILCFFMKSKVLKLFNQSKIQEKKLKNVKRNHILTDLITRNRVMSMPLTDFHFFL